MKIKKKWKNLKIKLFYWKTMLRIIVLFKKKEKGKMGKKKVIRLIK